MIYNAHKEFIFQSSQKFEICHASTLLVLSDESILAAWFGGSREGASDVAIYLSHYHNNQWSVPDKIADQDGIPHWNPVLFQEPDGKIWLFYKMGHSIPDWQTLFITSMDDGKTWSAPAELVPGDSGGRGPVRNKPIILSNGNWLAPASTEKGDWQAFTDISKDRGKTWIKSQILSIDTQPQIIPQDKAFPVPDLSYQGKGVIQPTVWESQPGLVHMLLRSTMGRIYRSDSKDYGNTWCSAYPIDLPNNNSGIDLTRMDDGTLVLICNPIAENWGKRTPLVIYTSNDNGFTWNDEYILEDQEGEYSYPAIVSRKNNIFLTYTWKRQRIAFWRLSL